MRVHRVNCFVECVSEVGLQHVPSSYEVVDGGGMLNYELLEITDPVTHSEH